ncbi:MAG: hypothetical protein ACRDXX_02325 [Stackebrandtia sp.]
MTISSKELRAKKEALRTFARYCRDTARDDISVGLTAHLKSTAQAKDSDLGDEAPWTETLVEGWNDLVDCRLKEALGVHDELVFLHDSLKEATVSYEGVDAENAEEVEQLFTPLEDVDLGKLNLREK